MKVTVTGASGFVGGAVCRDLTALGWTVRAVVRRPTAMPTAAEIVRGDLREPAVVDAAVRGTDVLVHAAGLAHQRPRPHLHDEFHAANVVITETVARAAAAAGTRLIYVSSSAAEAARTPYGRSKREAEERVRALGRAGGLPWTVVRPALLFGEGDPGNFLRLLVAVARRRYIHIDGGRARKSLSYVGNVGPALAALARSDRAVGRVFALADAVPRSVREIIGEIAACLGMPAPRRSIPAAVARTLGLVGSTAARLGIRAPLRLDMVDTLVTDAVVDTHDLEEEIGSPLPIPFGDGVRRTVEWYRHAHIVS